MLAYLLTDRFIFLIQPKIPEFLKPWLNRLRYLKKNSTQTVKTETICTYPIIYIIKRKQEENEDGEEHGNSRFTNKA